MINDRGQIIFSDPLLFRKLRMSVWGGATIIAIVGLSLLYVTTISVEIGCAYMYLVKPPGTEKLGCNSTAPGIGTLLGVNGVCTNQPLHWMLVSSMFLAIFVVVRYCTLQHYARQRNILV